MEIAVWVVQGLLGIAFLMAGIMKSTQSKEALAERGLAWVEDFDANIVKGIGVLEVLGAIGITLPILFGIAQFLTPLAAGGLVLTMIGAAITHMRRNELPVIVPNIILGALAAFVLWQYADLLPF